MTQTTRLTHPTMLSAYQEAYEARITAIMSGENQWGETFTREQALEILHEQDRHEYMARAGSSYDSTPFNFNQW